MYILILFMLIRAVLAPTTTLCGPVGQHGPFRVPVRAPVIDPFRLPAGQFGPGNRGLEYGTNAGVAVHAIGSGVVSFSGFVGDRRWVTVQHQGARRSTVGPLRSIAVKRGAVVDLGDVLGTTSGPLLLTIRHADTYVDPGPLLAERLGARLVPNGRFSEQECS